MAENHETHHKTHQEHETEKKDRIRDPLPAPGTVVIDPAIPAGPPAKGYPPPSSGPVERPS
jgi:hypothetical protein